jgi:hypothetical protein
VVTEPERALVRAVTPWSVPALALAVGIGWVAGGPNAAWSAAIGVVVVFANLNAYGWSLAAAARVSPTVLFAVAMGGYVVRLGILVIAMVLLDRLAFFSPLAFALAVLPVTVFVLVYELRMLSGPFATRLWDVGASQGSANR